MVIKEALLVIDVQNEYFSGLLPVTFPKGSAIKILQAMDAAHAAGMPVVMIQHSNHTPDAKTFRPGTWEWELHPEVKRRYHNALIEKTLPGSFTHTTLDSWLHDQAVTSLVISGYMSHMCCDTTARQAFHKGYAVKFLSDATGTLGITNSAGTISGADLHRAVLVTQAMRFSQVMTAADWIRTLQIKYS